MQNRLNSRIFVEKDQTKHGRNMELIFSSILIFFFSHTAQAKEVTIRWKPIKNIQSYSIQASTTRDFSNIIWEKESEGTQLKINLPANVYYLRVQGEDKTGFKSNWSKPFEFVVTAAIGSDTEVAI